MAVVVLAAAACNSHSNSNDAGNSSQEVNPPQLVGGDSDDNGCKASAGESWSKVKQKCIRVWEEGIQLTPVNPPKGETVFGAVVILADDKSKGELFIHNAEGSIWLMKFMHKEEVMYSGEEYKFYEKNKSWILEYKGKIIYKSK